jgi:1,2-dihydroxy-3-keto-5-methylthiopentene dioxygenase
MATLRIPDEGRTMADPDEIRSLLASHGVDYERWTPSRPVAADATEDDILAAYASEIESLKARGGYVTADVVNVDASTPGLDEMLARFNREHSHAEDEVRFVLEGHGLFHIHPDDQTVLAIELEPGDLIRVPRGILHWFDLCSDRRIRVIRLFQDPAGWVPLYTDSGVDAGYEPVCFGPAFVDAGH